MVKSCGEGTEAFAALPGKSDRGFGVAMSIATLTRLKCLYPGRVEHVNVLRDPGIHRG